MQRYGVNDVVTNKEIIEVAANSSNLKQIYTFGDKSRVLRADDKFLLEIFDNDMAKLDVNTLHNIISLARSPIANLMLNGQVPDLPIRPAGHKMLHFGIWMNNVKHYSGGRVHALLVAYHLASMGHKVTIITDMLPTFIKDFEFFDSENRVEYIHGHDMLQSNWLLNNKNNNIDIVICVPRILEGFHYAKRWSLPCYAVLLESPNFVSEYRNGMDGTEAYWQDYKNCIMDVATHVLCNPGPTLDAAKEWLKDFKGNIYDFPPPINTYAADRVVAEEKNEVTFIGRHVDFKCPVDVVKIIGKLPAKIRPSINFIGSHSSAMRDRILKAGEDQNVGIRFYANISEYEKYYIIKRSKMLIIPSMFEGAGMPPSEALYCGKPALGVNIPITKFIYSNSINYMKPHDISGAAKIVGALLGSDKLRADQAEFGKKYLWDKKSNIKCIPYKSKNNMRDIFYDKKWPKITAGMIVMNGADVIKITLDSIYDSVEKIVIVEGAVYDYEKANPSHVDGGHSVDCTLDAILNYPDPLKKIELVSVSDDFPDRKSNLWKNKNEMQNAIARRINTELYLKVDADEVWKESDIEYVRRLFMDDKDLTVLYMQRWHFWKNLQTVAVGGQWDSAEARAWRWKKDFRHNEDVKGGFNYYFDKDGKKVADPNYKCLKLMMRMHYHLGYCRDEKHIEGKINYYANRGIEQNVRNNYKNWTEGQPTNSTHPNGTTAQPFTGRLPIALDANYPKQVKVNPKETEENNIGMMHSPLKQPN